MYMHMQAFDIAQPGCNGKIAFEDLKYITKEQLKNIHDLIAAAEDGYISTKLRKLVEKGEPLPMEDTETDSGQQEDTETDSGQQEEEEAVREELQLDLHFACMPLRIDVHGNF